jgi:hypothetical protein
VRSDQSQARRARRWSRSEPRRKPRRTVLPLGVRLSRQACDGLAFNAVGLDYLYIGKGAAIFLGFSGTIQDVICPEKSDANGVRIVQAFGMKYLETWSAKLNLTDMLTRVSP